jgi:hypothetical protein
MSAMSEATRSPAVVDAGETAGRFASHHPRLAGEFGTVEEFIAHVLHRAHHAAQASDVPGEARTVLGLAQLFADELAAITEEFDRLRFIQAATHEPV